MNFLLQLAECMTNVVAVLASLLLGYLVCSHWTWMHLQRRPLPRSRLEGFGNENLSKKVVIIGSGVSGLVTAKMFVQYGFRDVLVLEQHGDLGGVWRENYCGAAVQGVSLSDGETTSYSHQSSSWDPHHQPYTSFQPYWWYYFADFP